MEEILHDLGWNPARPGMYKTLIINNKLRIRWCRISSINGSRHGVYSSANCSTVMDNIACARRQVHDCPASNNRLGQWSVLSKREVSVRAIHKIAACTLEGETSPFKWRCWLWRGRKIRGHLLDQSRSCSKYPALSKQGVRYVVSIVGAGVAINHPKRAGNQWSSTWFLWCLGWHIANPGEWSFKFRWWFNWKVPKLQSTFPPWK